MKTAIILEDEILALNRLKRMIQELDMDIQVVESFDTIEDTANYFINTKEHPDILFMDIQVADGNSFELFSLVEIKSKIIFATAYDEYAVEAFRKNALDYLLKPIKIEELRESVSKAKSFNEFEKLGQQKEGYKERFLLRFGSKFKNVKSKDISYILSKDRICYFFTFDEQKIPSDYNLQELESLLDPSKFFRINRQLIINIDSVKDMRIHSASRLKIQLEPNLNEEIVISTDKSKEFKQWLDR